MSGAKLTARSTTGTALHAWRLDHRLTIEALARLLGVSYQTVWRWEHGGRPLPLAQRRLEAVMAQVEQAAQAHTVENRASPRRPLDEHLLQEIVRRIVEAAAPEKIILFGSGARGKMGPDSDLDFLVIKECENQREVAQAIYLNFRGIPVPKDVVVATPGDIERYKDTIGLIYRPALREGRVVYAA